MRNLVFTVLVATCFAACAPTTPTPPTGGQTQQSAAPRQPNRCFSTDHVRNFRTDGNSRLFIRSTRNDVYEITLFAGCRNLSNATSISVRSNMAWLRNACVGDRVTVSSRVGNSTSCTGRVMRVLTPEQIEALPTRLRP